MELQAVLSIHTEWTIFTRFLYKYIANFSYIPVLIHIGLFEHLMFLDTAVLLVIILIVFVFFFIVKQCAFLIVRYWSEKT